MQMIVGLGNPGKRYEKNRHNIGFQCIDLLAARHGLRIDQKKGRAKVALATIRLVVQAPPAAPAGEGGPTARPETATVAHRLVLAKPQTFMNAAGQSVAALAQFYKIAPPDILVIFDDLDLPLGSLRLRASGGSGGHNGMKSIIRELGTDQFPRLRVGIDRPPGRLDPADYVLQDFSPAQEEVMADTRPRAADACEAWLTYGIVTAMNAFN
ncbi:MAG: aminoacyl-tRNA hydrolase [Anaerolineae bacterium]